MTLFAQHRIGDMPAIQLSDRQQVQHGDEQADPARECGGMQEEIVMRGRRACNYAGEQPEQQR